MKFTCRRDLLSENLALLSEVIPARGPKAILKNVLISGSDGAIEMTGTDLEIGMKCTMQVDAMENPEKILLPAHRLAAIARDEWAETMTFAVEDNRAKITTENGMYSLAGEGSDEYQDIGSIPEEQVFSIRGAAIEDAIRKTAFAVSRTDTRFVLNGIYLELGKNKLTFASSDTHRLSAVTKDVDADDIKPTQCIATLKGMQTLSKIASGEDSIKMHLGDRSITAKTENITLICSLIEGQFPKYKDILPKERGKAVSFDREKMISTLRLGSQFSNEETQAISLEGTQTRLRVDVSGGESGEGCIEIDAECDTSFSIKLNYQYLLDLLRIADDRQATLYVQDETHPLKFESLDFVHVIMPVQPEG